MNNEKIGIIGEAFIQKRVELGVEFDTAWDDWQKIQDKLMFVIVDCPEVQLYDDRRFSDRLERRRIRQIAKDKLGDHIRSADVSLLGRLARWLAVETPVQSYQMDRSIVGKFLASRAEAFETAYGFDERAANARELAESEELVDAITGSMERFAKDHGLWAVPNKPLIGLYINHYERLREATFECGACGQETVIPVDHSAGSWQRFTKVCPACRRKNFLQMFIHDNGEAYVQGYVDRENCDGDSSDP